MTPAQCKQARKLLGLTQESLGRQSGTDRSLISAFERSGTQHRPLWGSQTQLSRIQAALESAGIEFVVGSDDAPGVLLSASRQIQSLTPDQCRVARKLLGWSQTVLARKAGVNATAIAIFEKHRTMHEPIHGRQDRLAAMRVAFEAAGVTFTSGDEPGVKLKKTEP